MIKRHSNSHDGRGHGNIRTNRSGPSSEDFEAIAEHLAELRDERERLAGQLRAQTAKANLLSSVVLRCQDSANVEAALQCALVNICRHTGWPVGHTYTITRSDQDGNQPTGQPRPAGISHIADLCYAPFLEAVENMDPPPGAVMLKQALSSQKPTWMPDFREEGSFPAQDSTVSEPLIGAFALSVPLDHSSDAVLEFFSLKKVEPDPGMLEVAGQVARDLAAMISRKRTETMVRSSAQRFRRLSDQAPVPLVTFDNEGKMKHVNRAAAEFLDGTLADWKGREVREILPQRYQPVFQRFLRWLPTEPGRRHLLHKSLQGEVCLANGTEVPVEYALAAWSDSGKDLYTAVLFDLRARRQVEARAHHARDHLRDLLLEVKLREQQSRQKVAHRLHEDLAQLLAGCHMHLGHLSGKTTPDPVGTKLHGVSELIRQAVNDVRSISYQLSPPGLQDVGLEPALNWLKREFKKQMDVDIEITDGELANGLSEPVRLVLYQLLHDLISRLVHEHGSRDIRLAMVRSNERLRISVESALAPFGRDAESVPGAGQSATDANGLFAEIEHLTHLGGSMSAGRGEDGGPKICIDVPMTN